MIIEYSGEKISVQKENGDRIDFTAKELCMMKELQQTLFGENRTHVYLPIEDYKRLRRIRESGIALLDEVKATRDSGSTVGVISKFHDFKFAIFGRKA